MSLRITLVVMLWKAFMWHILFKDGTFESRDIDRSHTRAKNMPQQI